MTAGKSFYVGTALLLTGCLGTMGGEEDEAASYASYTGGIQAVCTAQVNGTGKVDVETEYVARVIRCEHGSAPPEALKAQAVAARTFLYYQMGKYGHIGDGQGSQVYTCNRPLLQKHRDAVKATSGQVMVYAGKPICAFYVAGSKPAASCVGTAGGSHTEKYVTYNKGRSGSNIQQSSIGWISASNTANRGCMSQLGSSCLNAAGHSYADILRFYYGADIQIVTAQGSCVGGGSPPPGPGTTPAPPKPTPPPPPTSALKNTCASYGWISTCQNSKDLLSCRMSTQAATIINCPHGCKLMPTGTSDLCKPGPTPPPPPAVSWSCAKSSFKGQQLWTCSGSARFRCVAGKPVKEHCPAGCKANATGTNDVCLGQPAPAPVSWSCAKSSYKGQQLWTCSGNARYRCFAGKPAREHCPAGCKANATGTNDVCK